jgi:hypothetical protein
MFLMWQKQFFLAVCIGFLLLNSAYSENYRCGTQLVSRGDLEIQVREKCGKPAEEKVIGYTLKGSRHHSISREREYVIEQWIYGPQRGFYHEIIFEAGRVARITQIKD